MKLILEIDALHHQIDSTDPETLGRWIVEIFARIKYPSPATYYRVQAWPSCVEDDNGRPRMDWIGDARYLEQIEPRSPRELLKQLGEVLDRLEEDQRA